MKIGLIIYDRLDTLTGGYIYDQMLVRHLRRRGHDLEIVSLARRSYLRNLLDNCSSKLFFRLISEDYDLLLQDELTHPSLGRVNRRLKKKSRFPVVAIVHQVLCRQPRNRLLNRLYEAVESPYFSTVDACIYNSASTSRMVRGLTTMSPPSIVALPAGDRLGSLDSADSIESRAREPGPLKLIFVGNVLPNKGLLPLIEDLSGFSKDSWYLTVVGNLEMNPVYCGNVKKAVAAAGLDNKIALAGPKDGPELSSLLSQSQVFVMPYSHEGFGMAHLEAMGFGLPVIACADGAVREFVKHRKNGFLVDPADRQKTLAYLNMLNADRGLLSDIGRAAWGTFQKHPRWEDTMEMIERFLCNMVSPNLS
jgi:glycosyltransferase involved in cell wall biosynthesis